MIVGIIHGGTSTERDVSTRNAGYICDALVRRGYDVRMLRYDADLPDSLKRERVDFVYLCVQGKGHGDGTLQGMLDFMRIPYTGSGMTAAAVINDKILCKELFAFHGHTTPPWQTLSRRDYEAGRFDVSALGFPFVAKAPTQGGSFGIGLVRSMEEMGNVETAFCFDDTILLEKYAYGAFHTVGVLEKDGEIHTLPCVEGVDRRAQKSELTLFSGSYGAKPSTLPDDTQRAMRDTAAAIFREVGARDYARVDFIVSDDFSRADVLEINAVPGLKPQSLLPEAAAFAGIAYDDLIEGILLNAVGREKHV